LSKYPLGQEFQHLVIVGNSNGAATFNIIQMQKQNMIQGDVGWISYRAFLPCLVKINKNKVMQTLTVHSISFDHYVGFVQITIDEPFSMQFDKHLLDSFIHVLHQWFPFYLTILVRDIIYDHYNLAILKVLNSSELWSKAMYMCNPMCVLTIAVSEFDKDLVLQIVLKMCNKHRLLINLLFVHKLMGDIPISVHEIERELRLQVQ